MWCVCGKKKGKREMRKEEGRKEEVEVKLTQANHWQHCFLTSDVTVGFTSIGSTFVGRITSPSGGSRICFCETIR